MSTNAAVLDQARKVVPAIAAANTKADQVLLIEELQDFLVMEGVPVCNAYPGMFGSALQWLAQVVRDNAKLRGLKPEQVLQEMSMAAAVRQANAV
jgi:hypothetical protein